jgi:DNA-binding protein YbaB
MKVTGIILQERKRELKNLIKVLTAQFGDSLFAFKGEEKESPQDIMEKLQEAELKFVQIELALAAYNGIVEVAVPNIFPDGKMTLMALVKMAGPWGRIEKMWREATISDGTDRWSRGPQSSRSKDMEFAEKKINPMEALVKSSEAAKKNSMIRAKIAEGNSVLVELDIDESLFE